MGGLRHVLRAVLVKDAVNAWRRSTSGWPIRLARYLLSRAFYKAGALNLDFLCRTAACTKTPSTERHFVQSRPKEATMAESVYKVIELVGTSTHSWEAAAKSAVDRAAETLRHLRVAEVVEQDLAIEDGKL